MKRRDEVRALLTPEANDAQAEAVREPPRVGSNAVRAIGLEIGRLTEEAREAEALRQQIASGAAVVELPTDLIDPSFVTDRLARTGDAAYGRLVESIRESGQQVPILVRPHPTESGRYQIAYGHRRHAALVELGRPVKAVVRQMSDAELVIAQGKENGERRDLTFIERAMFAAELERRGFDRATLTGALGVHTAEMTRLLSVAAAVPFELVGGIGPAPKAGRIRWLELARGVKRADAMPALLALLAEPSIRNLPSDRRFEAVVAAIRAAAAPANKAISTVADVQGQTVVRIVRTASTVRVIIDEKLAPGLGDLVVQEVGRLIGRYTTGQS